MVRRRNRHRRSSHFELRSSSVKGGAATATVLLTTQHHPFWDQTTQTWTNAADLTPGHHLLTADGTTVTITDVRNHTNTQQMRDLTVADTHTYYVVAGDTPVLVHNCGETLNGSGPAKGVLEVSDRAQSVGAVRNFNPSEPRDFVYDPVTGRFATGADQGVGGHDSLRTAIGSSADNPLFVGGQIIGRGPNGEILTNEHSGHYGQQ